MIDEGKSKIMMDEGKSKIQIKPRPITKSLIGNNKGLDELKQELKRLKKYIARLNTSSNYEEEILEKNKDSLTTLLLLDGSVTKGKLKDITKYQIVIEQDDQISYYYKSAIIRYSFG